MSLKDALKKAKKQMQDGDWKGGETTLKEFKSEDEEAAKENYMYWVMLGKCQGALGKAGEAEKSYVQATTIDEKQLPGWQGLRDVHLEKNDVNKAVKVLLKIMELAADNTDLCDKSASTVIDLVSAQDKKRLSQSSTTVDSYITKEVEARSQAKSYLTVPLLAHPAQKTYERYVATSITHRGHVYNTHAEADSILLTLLDTATYPSTLHEASNTEWATQRLLNYLPQAADPTAIIHKLTHLTQLTLRECLKNTPSSVPYWVLRTALMLHDFTTAIDDTLKAFCHALCPEDPPTISETSPRHTRNRAIEDIQLETRQKLCGAVLGRGRVEVILGDSPLWGVYSVLHAGALLYNEDVKDLEDPLQWLDTANKEAPEVVFPYAVRAYTLFRLRRFSEAVNAADLGLNALAARDATKTITPEASEQWHARIASVKALASAALRWSSTLSFCERACNLFPTNAALRLAAAETFLTAGKHPECISKLEGFQPEDHALGTMALWCKARALLASGDYAAALISIEAALGRCKVEDPYMLVTKAEIMWKQHERDACYEIATKAVGLDKTLARGHCLIGHYFTSFQKRPDTDGQLYSKEEFTKCYGRTAEWVAAGNRERRIDPADGNPYTAAQFEIEYGPSSTQWENAVPEKAAVDETDTKAIDAYRTALQYAPLDQEAGTNLCSIYNLYRKPAELLSVCCIIAQAAETEGAEAVQSNIWVFKLYGFESLRHGNYDTAIRCLRHCVRYCTGSDVAYALGRAYEGMGNHARALVQYKAVIAKGAEQTVVLAAQHGEACCLMRTDEGLDEAGKIIVEVTSNNPDFEPGWSLLAKIRWRQAMETAKEATASTFEVVSTLNKAVAAANESIRCSNKSQNSYRLKGDICLSGANMVVKEQRDQYYDDAIDVFRTVSQLCEGRKAALAHAYYDMARALFASYCNEPTCDAKRAEAEDYCRMAIKILPRCSSFWNLLGCATSSTMPNRRLWCINKALELDPKSFSAWCNQGWLLLLHSQHSAAKLSFERAQHASPSSYQPWLGIGLALQRASFGSMTYDARNCIEQAYEESQLSHTALLSLIAQHFYQPRKYGDIPETLGDRALAVKEAFSHDPNALNTVGLVLEELGNYDQAIEAFSAAEALLPREDKELTFEWVSGRNGLLPVRSCEIQQWSLCDAFTKYRMVLTSKLRALCKKGEGGSGAAQEIVDNLLALVPHDDLPYYESTSRAVLCSLVASRNYEKAAELLYAFTECADTVTHDAVLASLSIFRARQPDENSASILPDFGTHKIQDESIKRIAELVEEVGRCLRNPEHEPDLSIARTIPEKLLMYKVLLESGEGPPSIRYKDPTDQALIEFRQMPSGEVYYSVNGEARKPFTKVHMDEDEDGSYLEMPDIDASVSLPAESKDILLPRLLRMFAAAGVQHDINTASVGIVSRRCKKFPDLSARATSQLLAMVREVTGPDGKDVQLEDKVEVLYRFAGFLACMPEKLPDNVKDITQLLQQCVTVLSRVTSEVSLLGELVLFKAEYSLSLILYTAPHIFLPNSVPWEDVVQHEGDNEGDDEAQGGNDDDGSDKDALTWAQEIVAKIASEGYAEASTVLGLVLYSKGKYDEAIEVLSETLQQGIQSNLDWRRWDVIQCLAYCNVMKGDYDAAQCVLNEAAPGAQPIQLAMATAFIEHRRLLAQGMPDEAFVAITKVLKAYSKGELTSSIQIITNLVALSTGTDKYHAMQKNLVDVLPRGSLLKCNLCASLLVIDAWQQLKKDADGLPLVRAPIPNSAASLLQQAKDTWSPSMMARLLTVLFGIMKTDPTQSSEALDSLRQDVKRIDSTPVLYYWLSTVRDGVQPWTAFNTLLKEVGNAACDEAHLWFALKKVVETGITTWNVLCPPVKDPDPTKLKGKEYREAFQRLPELKNQRTARVEKLKGIITACLDKQQAMRPESPYVAQKRDELKKLS